MKLVQRKKNPCFSKSLVPFGEMSFYDFRCRTKEMNLNLRKLNGLNFKNLMQTIQTHPSEKFIAMINKLKKIFCITLKVSKKLA